MAGIPMYHGTSTFGEIEAKRARQRMDVLKTEEAEIDLDDYKKSKELMKKSAIKKLYSYPRYKKEEENFED